MKQKRTTVTIRYEEIDQTNSMVKIGFGIKDFNQRGLMFYQISRSRDLGEFVPLFTGEKKKNDRINGTFWDAQDFMMRDICRNDDNRLLRVEIFETLKKGNNKSLGSVELTIKEMGIDGKKLFTVFNKKLLAG